MAATRALRRRPRGCRPEFINDTGTMSADSFHPSVAGYGQIADALLPALLSVLGTAHPSGTP